MARWALIALLVASGAAAHDYWFEADPATSELLLIRGHRFSQHEGGVEPYDPAVVASASCVDATGTARAVTIVRAYPLRLPAGCSGLFVSIDAGFWTETEHGIFETAEVERDEAIDRWHSLETIKLIDRWHPGLARALSPDFEIVPMENPFSLAEGDKIRLLVTLDGKPVEGALVAYFGDIRGVTDSTGHINIRLREPGLQVIAAGIDEPFAGDEADRLVRTSLLQFVLP